MIRTFVSMAALAAGWALAAPVLASSLDGQWLSPTHHGVIELYDCGAAVCGRVVDSDRIKANPAITDVKNKTDSLRSRPLKGLVMLTGFTGGPPVWKGGSVYNPDDGGDYHGSIEQVDADTLKLTGCIIVPLCQTQTWHRVK